MVYWAGSIDTERYFAIAMKQVERTHLFEVDAIEACFYIIITFTAA